MSDPAATIHDLRSHLALCEDLLLLVERENQLLRAPEPVPSFDFCQRRKQLLPLLDQSLARLKEHRVHWQRQPPETRQRAPEISSLIRWTQDLIMKILMLDRENEKILLRRGLLPAAQLPPAARQRPHFVADLYLRHRPN